jgi:alpha-ribazole phosphatase
MQVILVRHGETAWNQALRYQGSSDVPLNDTGRVQAHQLATRLTSHRITAVWSSPLSRALETAQLIAAPHQLAVETETNLREISFGEWEGRTHAEIDAVDGERLAAWWADPILTAPPGGESLGTVVERVRVVLDRLRAIYNDDDVLVTVSHVGPIKAILFEALQLHLGRHWQIRIDRASLTTLAFTSRGAILMGCNDTCHLSS